VKYNRRARLDTGQVRDTRRSVGGKGAAIGGGGVGIVGIVIYLIVSAVGGSDAGQVAGSILGQLGQQGQPATADNSQIEQNCKTGKDANDNFECAIVADINSVQRFWETELPRVFGHQYAAVDTVWFSGQVSTGCGAADSGAGPFYCPADKQVYIDLSFYDSIKTTFHATGGLFVDAYVLAHEYGHHVQDLLGTEAKVRTQQGPESDSVRLELQADCYAGVWAKHATEPGPNGQPALVESISSEDFGNAVEVARRIGDNWIQKNLGNGSVNPDSFTHGTSAQRQKWLSTGYRTGDPKACDTFSTDDLG
jgi:uncharacterized protein